MNEKTKKISIFTIAFLIGILFTSCLTYALTPSTRLTITNGIYSGAPSYTIWEEGWGKYFAKDANGLLVFSGANASEIINDAITATYGNGGGTVFLKSGAYHLDSSIILKSYVMLQGEGWGEQTAPTLLQADGITFDVVTTDQNADSHHITISDLKIYGGKRGIKIGASGKTTDRPSIYNVMVWGANDNGVEISEGNVGIAHVDNLYVYGSKKNGLYVSGVDHFLTHMDIGGNVSDDTQTQSALYLYWAYKCTISESAFWAGDYGIYVNQAHNNRFIGDRVDLNWYDGIFLEGSMYNIFSGCAITANSMKANNTNDGIVLKGTLSYPTKYNTITGCNIGTEYIGAYTYNHRYAINEYSSGTGYVDWNTYVGNNVESYLGARIQINGTHSVVANNAGYHLGGLGATPIKGTYLVDIGGTSAISSGVTYTNVGSVKQINIADGTVSTVYIDGSIVFHTTNVSIVLFAGQTFRIDWTGAPTIHVWAM